MSDTYASPGPGPEVDAQQRAHGESGGRRSGLVCFLRGISRVKVANASLTADAEYLYA